MNSIKDLKVNLESKILASKNVVIVPHLGVDFDAFASAVGISLVAQHLQKTSSIIIDDPIYKIHYSTKCGIDSARKSFNIMNKDKYLKTATNDDLFVLTDVNKSNLICLAPELEHVDPDKIIIIDHHDEGDKTVNSNNKYINSDASSASEIILKLINNFKIKCPVEVANYLLAGIYLDTNRLSKNTNPETFKLVAKLMQMGATNDVIDSWFVEDIDSDQRVLGLVSKANIHKYSVAIVMAEDDCIYTNEELAKVADYLLKYGVDASFAIGKVDENLISVNARSKSKVNVGDVMKELNGGGNKCSAATKLPDETITDVEKKLRKIIEPPHIIK